MVLRQTGTGEYLLAPMGTTDAHWESWLKKFSSVKALLWRHTDDAVPKEKELLRRWQVVSAAGVKPKLSDFMAYGKPIAERVVKQWGFLSDMVVTEGPPPEAVTVPYFPVTVN